MAMPSWYQKTRYPPPRKRNNGRYNQPVKAADVLKGMSQLNKPTCNYKK